MYTDLDPAMATILKSKMSGIISRTFFRYWLSQTGNKLDGIRADFAQGLPPQVGIQSLIRRGKKWDFIFLAEALDPDPIRYRVSRYLDLFDYCGSRAKIEIAG